MAIPSIRDEYLGKYKQDRFKASLALALAFMADDPETFKAGYEKEPALLSTDTVLDLDAAEFEQLGLALGIEQNLLREYLVKRAS